MPSTYIERVGQGEEIVFVHGWGLNRSVWYPFCDGLEERFHCHLIDLPGFGRAQKNKVLEFDTLIDELAQCLPDQATYCGWSLGGLIAMGMAIKHPHKVKKLITISSSPCFVAQTNWPGIDDNLMSDFIDGIEINSKVTLKRFIGLQSLNSCCAKEDRKHLQSVIQSNHFPNQEALKLGLEWLRTINLCTEIQSIEVPWCAFFAENDAIVPIQTCHSLSRLKPDIEVHQLPQAGYLPFINYKEKIAISLG